MVLSTHLKKWSLIPLRPKLHRIGLSKVGILFLQMILVEPDCFPKIVRFEVS